MQLPVQAVPMFSALGLRYRILVRSVRRQLDKTGLFPDLTGEKGAELRKSVRTDGELTKSYMLMSALSAGIAALGLLQSSTAVVIGAMLISPLMGPIASMGFGFASLDGRQIREAVRVVAVGAILGILISVLLTWISPIRNATPEIIARTEPTLLDLAIATLSGVAGAFATVWQRGATAIGVAIATALMPPLATLGYAIAVGNTLFAGGALLLFLTNLAAISFSFALVARLSGAARPFAKVELNVRHVIAGLSAFLILATPLAIQLYLVTREARTTVLMRRVLQEELHIKRQNIAQLEVNWPLRGEPEIDAVVIAPDYRNEAEQIVAKRLEGELGTEFHLAIQQVVASNLLSQTRAIVDSAVERTVSGIAKDVPPLTTIRNKLGLPVQSLWVNRTERAVQVVPVAADGWTLADYRALEAEVQTVGGGWRVNIIPPAPASMLIPITRQGDQRDTGGQLDLAIWAIDRWGLANVDVAGFSGDNSTDADQEEAKANANLVALALSTRGIGAAVSMLEPGSPRLKAARSATDTGDGVEIRIVRAPDQPVESSPASSSPE